MNTSSIILGCLLVAALVIPILLLSSSGKKKKRAIIQNLQKLATATGAEITEFEIMYKCAIGLDPARKRVFFMHFDQPTNHMSIDLSGLKSVIPLKKSRAVQDGKEIRTVIDRLALQLVHRSPEIPPLELTFFDSTQSLILNDELPLLEKWSDRIGALLK